jgi:hypothetical protein
MNCKGVSRQSCLCSHSTPSCNAEIASGTSLKERGDENYFGDHVVKSSELSQSHFKIGYVCRVMNSFLKSPEYPLVELEAKIYLTYRFLCCLCMCLLLLF